MQNRYIYDKNLLEEKLKDYSITSIKNSDLKTLLSGMKVTNLKQLSQTLEIPNRSKMKKDELVEAILYNMLNSSELLKRTLLTCTEYEYELLINLSNQKYIEFQPFFVMLYSNLIYNGYVFILKDKKNYTIVISDEIKELVLQYVNQSFHKERELYQSVYSNVSACINLYGIITLQKSLELYNYYNESLSLDKFTCIMTELLSQERFFVKVDNYLFHKSLLEDNRKEDLLKIQKSVSTYYLPNKEIFLQYAKSIYPEKTSPLYTLESYISQYVSLKDISLSDVLSNITTLTMMGKKNTEILNVFDIMNIELSGEEQVQKISQLIQDVIDNTRLWATKGFTNKELYSQTKTSSINLSNTSSAIPTNSKTVNKTNIKHYKTPIRVIKIGRNSPCTCGSGKKYKKCCGK